MPGYSKHLAGAVKDQRESQAAARSTGHKLPGYVVARIKRQQELEKQIQALKEYIACTHEVKPYLAVGEFAWHEARRKANGKR